MTTVRSCAFSKRAAVHLAGARKTLPVPERARKVQRAMVERLETLLARQGINSCLDPQFTDAWREVLALAATYQQAVIEASEMTVSCGKGCSACCCHWVEDVNSFEAEIIADYLRRYRAHDVPRIVRQCHDDNDRLLRLNAIVERKLAETQRSRDEDIDPVDLLLASFYQLGLECPLLENGACMVYEVRPLTCRMYVSFSDPLRCNPEYINVGRTPTYLFDPGEKADRLIDALHFRFLKFDGDTGLRSLLIKYLS